MRNAGRLRRTTSTPQSHFSACKPEDVPERDWIDRLLPSERRNLRVAAKAYLGGLVSREEIKATIDASRLVALSREAAELRGGL